MEKYKAAIINGRNDIDPEEMIGQIDHIGSRDEREFHIMCLLEYAREKYPELDIFQKLTFKHQPEVASYFLVRLNHIVFLNTSSLSKSGKGQNTGMLLLPPITKLAEAQRESLDMFCDEIEDFNVSVFFDMNIDEGFLAGQERYPLNQETPKQMVELYYNQANKNEKVSRDGRKIK